MQTKAGLLLVMQEVKDSSMHRCTDLLTGVYKYGLRIPLTLYLPSFPLNHLSISPSLSLQPVSFLSLLNSSAIILPILFFYKFSESLKGNGK